MSMPAGFPCRVMTISSDSARCRKRDRSSLTSASATWRIGRSVFSEPARRLGFRDDCEDLDGFVRDVIETLTSPTRSRYCGCLKPQTSRNRDPWRVSAQETRVRRTGVADTRARRRNQARRVKCDHSNRRNERPVFETLKRILRRVRRCAEIEDAAGTNLRLHQLHTKLRKNDCRVLVECACHPRDTAMTQAI